MESELKEKVSVSLINLKYLEKVLEKNLEQITFENILYVIHSIEVLVDYVRSNFLYGQYMHTLKAVHDSLSQLIKYCDQKYVSEIFPLSLIERDKSDQQFTTQMVQDINNLHDQLMQYSGNGLSSSNNELESPKSTQFEVARPAAISKRPVSDIFFVPTEENQQPKHPVKPKQHNSESNNEVISSKSIKVNDNKNEDIYMSLDSFNTERSNDGSSTSTTIEITLTEEPLVKSSTSSDLIEQIFEVFQHLRTRDEDGEIVVVGGTVDALIVYAIEYSDFEFMDAFFSTYRTFITPDDLLRKLIRRLSIMKEKVYDLNAQNAAKNTFTFLQRVIIHLECIDLRIPVMKLLGHVMLDFIYPLIQRGQIKAALYCREQILKRIESAKIHNFVPVLRQIKPTVKNESASYFLRLNPRKVAEQITILDSEYFYRIEVSEILKFVQKKNERDSPNVCRYIEFFNRMNSWVKTVVFRNKDLHIKTIERKVGHFSKILRELIQLNNFNSAMAIHLAIESQEILKFVSKRDVDRLNTSLLFSTLNNYQAYRAKLIETSSPGIPFLGIILKDMTFVHVGNNDYIESDVVNFSKKWIQNRVIDNFKRFKYGKYKLTKDEDISNYLNNFDGNMSNEDLRLVVHVMESLLKNGNANHTFRMK